MRMLQLVTPSREYAQSFSEALQELSKRQEDSCLQEIGSPKTIDEYIGIRTAHAEGKNLPTGWIPSWTFWLVDRGAVVGESNLRSTLTPHLRTIGGHIGYWIRPTARRKGYGTIILQHTILEARARGITRILITCDETNIASRTIIERNGGVFEGATNMGPDHPKKLRFWIES